jgi:Uma2 family endonuclease
MNAVPRERRPIPGKRYTYADYYTWNDGKRYELIDGTAYLMEPALLFGHQKISGALHTQLSNFLMGKPGEVFYSPFDVRLNFDKGDNTVLQPDVIVFCDTSKLSGTGCIGAPDMVIEILSPSTARRDRVEKFNQYLLACVKEYWIVDPDEKTVNAYILESDVYIGKTYRQTDEVPVFVLDGCVIKLSKVF